MDNSEAILLESESFEEPPKIRYEFPISFYEDKNDNKYMEDRHILIQDIDKKNKSFFFGIYDGHGGSSAAEYTGIIDLMSISKHLLNSS